MNGSRIKRNGESQRARVRFTCGPSAIWTRLWRRVVRLRLRLRPNSALSQFARRGASRDTGTTVHCECECEEYSNLTVANCSAHAQLL